MFERLLMLIIPIVGVFNFAAGIVAFIWLAIIGGHWGYILKAVGILWLGIWVLSILLLPTLLLMPFVKWAERRKRRTYFLSLVTHLFTMSILGLWSVLVMSYFHAKASNDSEIPMLLLGYAAGVGVFQFLASKERDNQYTMLSAGVATIGAFITFCLILGNVLALVIPTWVVLSIAESHMASSLAASLTPEGEIR